MSDQKERIYLIDNPKLSSLMLDGFFGNIPHSQELGLEVVSTERNKAVLRIPFAENLVGNQESGIIHAGVLLSLLDSAGGMATFCALPAMEAIATLDLRVDYLKPAMAGKGLEATGECYKLTNSVAFIRGVAYQDDANDPVASFVATFMRASSSKMQGVTK